MWVARLSADRRELLFPPPPQVEHFSFGFNDALADGFWLRFIQDMEACKIEQIKGVAPKTSGPRTCDKGWGYHMLVAITNLAPRFRMPCAVGPLTLSVLTNDYAGAGILFDKAVKQFPHDWPILYRAAYHYIADDPKPEKAADLLVQAGKNGAPEWVNSLAAKLYNKAGRTDFAIGVLKEYQKQLKDEKAKEHVQTQIDKLLKESQ